MNMDSKPLLFGLIGFFLGGLLVSVAATTFEKPADQRSEVSMSSMIEDLKDKSGDEYDALFISHMIDHHQSAVDMAKLSGERAKHAEIKGLSEDIITAQQAEIDLLRQWQQEWGYAKEHKVH